jgi:ribosome-binding protein aMBF1 (putative translation factor)
MGSAKQNLKGAVGKLLTMQAVEGEIGKMILAFREESSKLQRDLAADLGISAQYLSDIECGRRGISADLLSKLELMIR